MTAEEEAKLRESIRQALAHDDWERDIGFILCENEADGPQPFEVLVSEDGYVSVVIPGSWEQVPYMAECLQAMADQELRAHCQPDAAPN